MLFLCFFIGINGRKEKKLKNIKDLLIIPLISIGFFVAMIYQLCHLRLYFSLIYAATFLPAFVIGFKFSKNSIKFDEKIQTYILPGSWNLMILFMGIYCFEFYLGYLKNVNLVLFEKIYFLRFVIRGSVIGFFIGKCAKLPKLFKKIKSNEKFIKKS